jgi:5'-nucleotidase
MDLVSRHPFDWDHYDTVLLDMDGTLLDLRFDNFFWQELIPARYAALNGLPHEEAVAVLEPRFAATRGTLEWYCLDHWSRELGLDVAALKREAEDHIDFLPDVPDFLVAVRELRKRVVLVTNAHRGSLVVKLARTGLERYWTRSTPATISACPRRTRRSGRGCGPSSPSSRRGPCWWTTACRCCARRTPTASAGWSRSCARTPRGRRSTAEDFHGVDSVTELLPPRRRAALRRGLAPRLFRGGCAAAGLAALAPPPTLLGRGAVPAGRARCIGPAEPVRGERVAQAGRSRGGLPPDRPPPPPARPRGALPRPPRPSGGREPHSVRSMRLLRAGRVSSGRFARSMASTGIFIPM